MVERLDGLPLLPTGHRGSVDEGPTDREGPTVPLVPDPDEVSRADRRVRLRDPWRHDVRSVRDVGYGPHVDGHLPTRRRMGEEAAHGRDDRVVHEEGERIVAEDEKTKLAGFRLIDHRVLRQDGDPELR